MKSFWKKKRVLVTGHEGFLGSNLTRTLVNSGAVVIGVDIVKGKSKSVLTSVRKEITSIKGDISDLSLVKRLVNKYKPKIVFHLAAEAIVGRSNKFPVRAFKSNIEGTWNVLESCRGKKFIKAIVVASSDKAYGAHKDLPYTENMPLQGNHPYDVSKSCTDLLAYTYYRTYGLPVCMTRCGNIYGPGDWNLSRLVPDAIKSVIKNKQFIIRSDGKFTRDYVYVDDIVSGYMNLAEKMNKLKIQGQAFNFSNEQPLTVIKFFKEVVRVSRKKYIKPKILNQAQYEIKHQFFFFKKARRILNWKPQYDLQKGLEKTLEWYKSRV